MFQHSGEFEAFRTILRDFLISIKEFSSGGATDNADLYIADKEAEQERKLLEERELAVKVPGILKPSELLDDDTEL